MVEQPALFGATFYTGQVVFASLAERYPGLKLTGQPVQWQANPAYRGLRGLAVTF